MNIAFDAKRIASNVTGLGNYSRYIVRSLAEWAPENHYLLYTPKAGHTYLYEDLLEHRCVQMRMPESECGASFGSLWRNWGLKKSLKVEDVDLYHGLSNELPIGLYNDSSVGTVVTIHDLAYVRYPQFYKPVDRLLYNLKYRASARHADHVIAVSEFTRRDIIDCWGVEPERVSVVYQGCSPRFALIKPEEVAFVRGHYQLPEHYILFVGSIEERKNLRLVVQALSMLGQRDIHLVAVGKRTPYSDAVLSEVSRLGLSSRVHFMHSVPTAHLPGFYGGASLFVYPSRFEGFGIPLIEALHAGVPVVGATGSCLEEAGGPHSLYTDPDDAHMLCELMQRALSDTALRSEMIEQGRLYVRRFSSKSIARSLRSIYEQVSVMHD